MLWEFYGILMGFSIGFLLGFYDVFYGIPMGFPMGVSMMLSMIFLWDYCGISRRNFYEILMGLLCGSYAISMLFL